MQLLKELRKGIFKLSSKKLKSSTPADESKPHKIITKAFSKDEVALMFI